MPSIKLLTEVPGPESRRLALEATLSVARPVAPEGEFFIRSGSGSVVEDVDGNRLLDLVSGLGCLAVGHCHPEVVWAVRRQAELFLHTDYNLIAYRDYHQLADRIATACGGDRRVAFFNSGAEAVENGVKVARAATGRPGIVCFEGAFHGRTHFALSLTHRDRPYRQGFGPFASDVHRVPYPGLGGCGLDEWEKVVSARLESGEIAAAVVEPILGEGGVVVPPDTFLPKLQDLCARHGTLLVVDEVQTGYGRTGRFLASQHCSLDPDLILLGKSIASGLPLSAVVGHRGLMDRLEPHTLGGTYVGNPLALAAGIAVLDIMESQALMNRAEPIGAYLVEGWLQIAQGDARIKGVRGRGAMVGVAFNTAAEAETVVAAAVNRGVVTTTAGLRGNVVRHLPPLVVSDDELEEAMAGLRAAVRES